MPVGETHFAEYCELASALFHRLRLESAKAQHWTPLLQKDTYKLGRFMGGSTKVVKALEEPEDEKNANR